jgi:hypothetical protein
MVEIACVWMDRDDGDVPSQQSVQTIKETTTMKTAIASLFIALLATSVTGYSVPTESAVARRQALGAIFGGSVAFIGASAANALDMDAFANSQIEADTKNCNPKLDPKCIPKLTTDEALCKYGQSGQARGEACKRVKQAGGEMPSAKPAGKSLGGAYAM